MPGNISVSGAASPIEITGLSNGVSYTFTVTAQNNLGDGAASQASNSVTPSASTALVNPLDKNTTVSIVNNQLIINYQAANGGMLSAKLISLNGQIIQSQTNAIVAGNNKLSMNIQALQAGVYILELTDNIHSLICKKISKN
jgi:hypothetical protein